MDFTATSKIPVIEINIILTMSAPMSRDRLLSMIDKKLDAKWLVQIMAKGNASKNAIGNSVNR